MNNLQLFSFEINESTIIEKTLYVMKFPRELRQLIEYLKSLKAKDFGYNFALRGLAKIVKNYSREVVSVSNNHYSLLFKEGIWICSTLKFNLEGLRLHICQWINSELKRVGKLTKDFYLEEDLSWDDEISSRDVFNGNYDIYEIIPNLYGKDFCREPLYFDSINKSFKFYPLIGDNGVSLISEPIIKEYGDPFSYNIKILLIKPYDGGGKLYLNISMGTKLWLINSLMNEKGNFYTKEGTSLYIFKKDEFVREQGISFIQCSFVRDYANVKWKNSYDAVYTENIGLDVNKIVRNPEEYMDFNSNIICLITNKRKDSFTKRGAGMPERIEVFKLFKAMYPASKPKEEIGAISYNRFSKTAPVKKLEKSITELRNIEIKKWIKKPLKFSETSNVKKFIVDIYSVNESLFKHSVNISKMLLGLKEVSGKLLSPDGIEFQFVNNKKNISRALLEEEDKHERISEIENEVAYDLSYSCKHIALVDIPDFHKIDGMKILDSKSSVRIALKNRGIISQFINGFDEVKGHHRLINALYDLYYASGFLNDEFYRQDFHNKVLIGLDFVPGYNGKYLVMSKIEKGRTYYRLYNDEVWVEASDFICDLSEIRLKKAAELLFKEKSTGVNNWICNTLQELIDRSDSEIYILADAGLRQSYWKYLTNDNFKLDQLEVVDEGNRLKVLRINNTNENPDYCIGDGSPNLEKGLFSNDYEVFYMVGARGDTFKINTTKTRYDNIGTPFVKQKVTEMIILGGKSEEEREEIAKDCYALRKLVPTYEKEVLLPLPMYVIKRIGEYIGAMEEVTE